MAQIPAYQPNVSERPILQSNITVRASPEDMGASIGRGLQQLGQGAQQAATAMQQLQELEDITLAKERETQFAELEREARFGEGGYMTLQGHAAVEAQSSYYARLSELQRQFGADLRPGARQRYLQTTNAHIQSAKETAAVHASRERKSWFIETSNSRVTMAADDALAAWQMPGKVTENLHVGLGELQQQAALQGWDADTLALRQQQFTSVVTAGVVQRIALEDPIAAVEYMTQNQDKLTADDGFVLSNNLLPLLGNAAGREAAAAGSSGPMVNPGSSVADVVRQFEGFRTVAYWDVNHYRVGYGSDTVTRADGTVVKVTEKTAVTRADAERDLERRLGEFQVGIVGAVGEQAWSSMDQSTQAALTSVAYNYGSLPGSVVAAVSTGDRAAIAAAVEALGSHNDGVNRGRRAKEAALIRQGTGAGVQFSPRVENLLSALPANQAVMVREAATQQLLQEQTRANALAKAEYDRLVDTTALKVVTGEIKSEQEILTNPDLQPGDIVTLVRSFRSENESTAGARNYLAALQQDTAPTLNPFSTDDQATADKSFELLLSDLPAETRGAAITEFVTRTQMIPKELVAGVRMGLASTGTNQVAQSMQLAAMLVDKAPVAVGAMANAKDIQDAAAIYAELVGNQGMSVEQAAYQMVQKRLPENTAKAADLKPLWDRALTDDQFKIGDVLGAFGDNPLPGGPVAGVTPHLEAALTSDYLRAAETAFNGAANGDVNLARSMALAELKRTYGVSRVSGSEAIVKFPPEGYYPPINGSHDYIRDLALADARSITPRAGNVMLVATPETSQDVRGGKPPRYNLFYQSPEGVWDMAPSLFMVDQDSLGSLAKLDSEERQVKFEMGRLYEQAMRTRQNDPVLSTIERTMGGMITPKPADVVPGYAEYEARLLDINLRRRNALGQSAPAMPSQSPAVSAATTRADAMAAESEWATRNAATFGPMGGTR
jgi:GH24 family phage-related lysozyme (muramidase)